MKYASPTTIAEAIDLLSQESDSQVFAGATDLIPQMRGGRQAPALLVDLKHIAQLMSVERSNGTWHIGAAVPTARLAGDPDFSAAFPGLAEASGLIGSDQIQNRSSWGGNLANASPAADTVPAMMVNGVRVEIVGADGTRMADVAEVVVGPGQTSLAKGEFISTFIVSEPAAHTSDAYLRLIPRSEMDIAVVGAAASVTMDGEVVATAKVALGAVAPTCVRVGEAEEALRGATISEEVLAEVARAASDAANPIDDKRGTIQYRKQVAGVLAKRAVKIAVERANRAL